MTRTRYKGRLISDPYRNHPFDQYGDETAYAKAASPILIIEPPTFGITDYIRSIFYRGKHERKINWKHLSGQLAECIMFGLLLCGLIVICATA